MYSANVVMVAVQGLGDGPARVVAGTRMSNWDKCLCVLESMKKPRIVRYFTSCPSCLAAIDQVMAVGFMNGAMHIFRIDGALDEDAPFVGDEVIDVGKVHSYSFTKPDYV
jgi:hypothetical protein